MRTYDYYEASPDAVRLEAFHARSSASALYNVSDNVSGRHRESLAATDGELTLAMTGADRRVVDYTSKVNRSAIWAALQVENFADAIETYNTGSTDPMSISRLNAKVQSVNEMGISVVLCLAGPQPSGAGDTVTQAEQLQWETEQQAAYQSQLDGHYRRLGGAARPGGGEHRHGAAGRTVRRGDHRGVEGGQPARLCRAGLAGAGPEPGSDRGRGSVAAQHHR